MHLPPGEVAVDDLLDLILKATQELLSQSVPFSVLQQAPNHALSDFLRAALRKHSVLRTGSSFITSFLSLRSRNGRRT